MPVGRAQTTIFLLFLLILVIAILGGLALLSGSVQPADKVTCDGLKSYLEAGATEALHSCVWLTGQRGGVLEPGTGEAYALHRIAHGYNGTPSLPDIAMMERDLTACLRNRTNQCLVPALSNFEDLGCGVEPGKIDPGVTITATDVSWRATTDIRARDQVLLEIGPGTVATPIQAMHEHLDRLNRDRSAQVVETDVPLTRLRDADFNLTVIELKTGSQIYAVTDPGVIFDAMPYTFLSAHWFS